MRSSRTLGRSVASVGLLLMLASVSRAQTPAAESEPAASQAAPAPPEATPVPTRTPAASDFWLPMGSLVLPGLGQYVHGSGKTGLAFTGTALVSLTTASALLAGEEGEIDLDLLTSDTQKQMGNVTGNAYQAAAFLSAYDAFHRSVPELQRRGEYRWLTHHEPTSRLFGAPFAFGFVKKKTTWIPLALSLGVAVAVEGVGERGDHDTFRRFRAGDAAYVGALSYEAGVGEEAFFRGYALPLAHRRLGSFWAANATQAALFGAMHISRDSPLPVFQTVSALYDGWLTNHNGGSVRESIFQHVWYDVIVLSVALLVEERKDVPVAFHFSVSF